MNRALHFSLCLLCCVAVVLLVRPTSEGCKAAQENLCKLIHDLRVGTKDAQLRAAAAIEKLGPQAKDAIPALISALGSDHEEVRDKAAYALASIGADALPALIAATKKKDPRTTLAALGAFRMLYPLPGSLLPVLHGLLKDPDAAVQADVPFVIALLEDDSSIPVLCDALRPDAPDKVQTAICAALSTYGPRARIAVPKLIKLVKTSPAARGTACAVLGEIGSASVPALVETLEASRNWRVRESCAQALSIIGPKAREAVPALVRALTKERSGHITMFVWALGEIGPDAAESLPLLKSLCRGAPNKRFLDLAVAISKIDRNKEEASSLLVRVLEKGEPSLKFGALGGLGRIGPEAKLAVPAIVTALEDSDPLVRVSSANALGLIGVNASAALPHLRRRLKDPDLRVREEVELAIRRIAPD